MLLLCLVSIVRRTGLFWPPYAWVAQVGDLNPLQIQCSITYNELDAKWHSDPPLLSGVRRRARVLASSRVGPVQFLIEVFTVHHLGPKEGRMKIEQFIRHHPGTQIALLLYILYLSR